MKRTALYTLAGLWIAVWVALALSGCYQQPPPCQQWGGATMGYQCEVR